MHTIVRKTLRVNTSDAEDLQTYDTVLNNPLCTVVKEIQEKIKETEYNEEGKPSHSSEYILLIITYEEKKLL